MLFIILLKVFYLKRSGKLINRLLISQFGKNQISDQRYSPIGSNLKKISHSMEDVISNITKDTYDGKDGLDAFASDVNLIFS